MERIEVKFATDDVAADGTFEGYGAAFGNVDAYGDVIVRGAFKASLREWNKAKSMPPMLVQHGGFMMTDMDALPVGKWLEMSEDDVGLRVKGKLINLDTERGKTIHGAMKEDVLNGLSIGFRAKEFTFGTKPDEPRRTLKSIDLVEVSVVTFPANGRARIDAVKAGDMTERDFERMLTQDAGLSRSVARRLMAGGYDAVKAMQDAGDGIGELAQFMRETQSSKGQTHV